MKYNISTLSNLFASDRFIPMLVAFCIVVIICATEGVTLAAEVGATTQSRATVVVKGFVFTGNESLDAEALGVLLDDAIGRELALADLEALADRVTEHYRLLGFLVARASIPPQRIEDGVVHIAVLEGRYGRIELVNDSRLHSETAEALLGLLVPGEVIARRSLERTLRLLDTLPGVEARGVLSAGESVGTSDLALTLKDGPAWQGSVVVDSFGNEYTGRIRAGVDAAWNNPLGRGDRLAVGFVSSGTGLRSWRTGYEGALHPSGLRAGLAYSQVAYGLGGALAGLDATGQTQELRVDARYPLILSDGRELHGGVALERRTLRDDVGSVGLVTQKQLGALVLELAGNARIPGAREMDFQANLAYGDLRFASDDALATDQATARSAGRYARLGVRGSGSLPLGAGMRLDGTIRGQLASKNLETSLKFALGGFDGVRAYPTGEASGDQGWLGRVGLHRNFEARVVPGRIEGLAFLDGGRVQVNRLPWPGAGDPNVRTLLGAGVGVVYRLGAMSFEVIGAAPLRDEAPMSGVARPVRWWLQTTWHF